MIRKNRRWGAHMSIAGGVSKAVKRASDVGARSIQIFTKNNNQWIGKPLSDEEREKFFDAVEETSVEVFAAHDCYLINLASPDRELHKKSMTAFLDEIDRADALDIPCLVFHPGAHVGTGDKAGIEKVAKSLDMAIEKRADMKTKLTIETTAGQGSGLGWRFEQIAQIMELCAYPEKLAVCVDTCHIYAAGYDIKTKAGYKKTFEEFDRLIGLENLAMFHVNDSKKDFGTRVDRHEHIGEGFIGPAGFKNLVNDKRFFDIPMILETPKGADNAEDRVNLKKLDSYQKA